MSVHSRTHGLARLRGRSPRMSLFAGLTAASIILTPAGVFVQTADPAPAPPPSEVGQIIRLDPAEAAKAAREVRASQSVQLADGLEVSVWATGPMVLDPLALDVDDKGVVYVGASPRSGQLLDTRQHPDWVPELHALKTVEDLRQFFRRKMAPELSEKNTWLPDENGDGSRDYRDLTVIKERIYRLEDTSGDGVADTSRLVFAGFNEDVASDILGGLMLHNGDIYATAAPDLWRLRDTDGDGIFDEKTSISHGYSVHPSFSGHDMSAVTQGPDGRIYWKIGEIGMNVVDKTGKRWAHPHTGAVLRSNPDGTDFEVFASGVRNPQEMGFDKYGNLVAVDNDGDYPGETERVIYIAEGQEVGWRSNWQFGKYTDPDNNRYNVWIDEGLSKTRFDGQAAYITPPIAPHAAGPSGFAYNPGTALDPRWKDHFFVTSFTGNAANARIYAFQLKEKGAGFELGTNTQIVQGVLSPGMKIGPDGAMYLTDWVRGWGATGEGRVWKLDAPASAGSAIRTEVKQLLNTDLKQEPLARVRGLLGHEDMRIRQRAQFELVRRNDGATLLSVAGEPANQLARIHALWGMGQLLRAGSTPASAFTPFLTDTDAEIRAQAAKMLGDARSTSAVSALVPLLQDPAPRVRFFAAQALGRTKSREAFAPIVQMLAANDDADVYLRQAGVAALTSIEDRNALAALVSHTSRGVRLAAVVALRRLQDEAVARFLDDADALVVTEAARAINDEGGIVALLPALARLLERPGVTGEPLIRRALSANLRVGDAAAVERVAAFVGRAGLDEELRVEALAVLGVWAAPSNLDRVDGAWIGPLQNRDAAAARAAVTRLASLLDAPDSSAPVKIAMIEAAAKLGLKTMAPQLLARLRTDSSADVRVAALGAILTLESPQINDAVQVALADADGAVRMAAIAAIPSTPIANGAKVTHLVGVIEKGTVGEQQSALGALGGISSPEASAALTRMLDGVSAGTVAAAVQLDVLEAARATKSEPLQARLDKLGVGRSLENLAKVFPAALTNGGNVARGRQVVLQHPAAQCTRCHIVGQGASTVGPSLNGVGARLSREELLQSLIDPSAKIAPGFGQVSVTLRNGQKFEGVLREENETTMSIEDPTRGMQRINKADVATSSNAVSAMPPMGLLLQPREIRDVIEAMAQQR